MPTDPVSTEPPANRRPFPPRAWPALRTAAFAAVVVALVVVVIVGFKVTSGLPDAAQIRDHAATDRVTMVYDAYDKPLFPAYKEERIEVPLSQIAPDLIHAVIAVEDEHFYKHYGFDAPRIVAALLSDLRHGTRAQGGSTITQQLAKKTYLDDRKTIWRKWRELALAIRIERQFTKDKILEMYLNKVYFGHGFYGVEAAARGYFGKPASRVNTAEAALLAGLIQAPSAYAPQAHPQKALARRSVVLMRMVDAGYLTKEQADRLRDQPIQLQESRNTDTFARYFKNYLIRQLVQRFGEDEVFDGGLRVYSTFDPAIERAAEQSLAEGLARIEQRKGYKHPKFQPMARSADEKKAVNEDATPYLQGALVAMDPSNGFIRALVGGRDFEDSPFDRATMAKRQAGSAFKPFIYAAALESGYTPSTLVTGLDATETPAGGWLPEEAHGSSADSMTMRMALRTSNNRAAVRVLTEVGIPRAETYVKRLGFTSVPAVPSMALGTGSVSVLSLTTGYAAFANGGLVPQPTAIRRVEDRDGNVLFSAVAASQPAISAATAFLMAQMLADVVNSGTGYRVRQEGLTVPAGGKTGTTDDYHDAWFAGFTTSLVASVWVGFDQPQTIMANGFAGDLAAPIWGRFMRAATKNAGRDWVPQPPDVVSIKVCRLSGLLPAPGCSHVMVTGRDGVTAEQSMVATEYFRRGTEPTQQCMLHPDDDEYLDLTGDGTGIR